MTGRVLQSAGPFCGLSWKIRFQPFGSDMASDF